MANIIENLRATGVAKITELELTSGLERQYLAQEDLAAYPVDLTSAVVWDSGQPLPATAAADDLALIAGTFGTANLYIVGRDSKVASLTGYARITVALPPEYVAGQTITLRISGGMLTTVSDTTATVDVECYLVGRTTLKSGSDLCATAATSINSLTFADKDFTITPTALEPGDVLDIRLTLAVVDAATGTAVKAAIGAVDLLCDIKG